MSSSSQAADRRRTDGADRRPGRSADGSTRRTPGGVRDLGLDLVDRMPSWLRRERRSAAGSGARKDIQGLRAFAVLAVVLHHLLEWPSGGFVGVDVFFVISGFLITGLLLREQERSGRISFAGFYRRRAKRILPAATIVIVASVVAALFVYGQSRAGVLVGDAVAALLFVSNWRFAAESTDYFSQSGPESPLQQFWSLAVEEQFYLAWPVLIVFVFWLLARGPLRGVAPRAVLTGVLALVVGVSFTWSLWETQDLPTRAYFSTLSRTWELGAGALLAVSVPALSRLPGRLRPLLAWTGLGLMTASLWLVTPTSAFPAPAAALPVLGTALVIAAGTGSSRQPWLGPLISRPATYVGDISYSLYLWHWPIIVLGTAVWGRSGAVLTGIAVAAFAVSAYSYHLVEDPIRRSSWLEPGTRSVPWRDRLSVSSGQQAGWTSLAVVLSVLLLVGLQRSVPVHSPLPTTPVAAEAGEGAVGDLQAEVSRALQATSWPDLEPSMEDTVGSAQAPDEVLACGTRELPIDECAWGPDDASRTAVVLGDSIGMTYVGAVRAALPDWRVVSLGGFGCTFTTPLISNPDTGLQDACPARKDRAVSTIRELQPDLVLVSHIQYPRQPVGAEAPLTEREWSTETAGYLEGISAVAGEVVVLAPPPADQDVNECYTRVSEPSDCVSDVQEQWEARATTERDMARSLGGVWLDSSEWFCVEGRCPAFVGTTPTKVDQTHMTPEYAEKIAPALREALAEAGVVPRATAS